MNFQEQLKQQLAQQTQGEREEIDFPSKHLKHKELYFPKVDAQHPVSSVTVRILPPAIPGDNYNVMAREIFLTTRNHNQKDLKLNAVLSAFPNQDDPLDVALVQWNAENRVPNSWNKNATPSKRYYVNVVQVFQNQQGQMVHETDEQGNLVVRLLKLPHSACQELNAKLIDAMLRPRFQAGVPEDVTQYSFISSVDAYPVTFTKPVKGSGQMSYGVQVYSNLPLGALPYGWENSLEDLAYQATPSYKYSEKYVKDFIDIVNGVTPVRENQAPQQSYQAPVMTQGYMNAPQQPVAPFQPQPQVTTMSTPPTMTGGFTQPVPQAPATQPTVITDASMPFDFQAMPDVNPPQATSVPEQPVAQVTAPATESVSTPTTDSGLPDVDSLLAQMGAK